MHTMWNVATIRKLIFIVVSFFIFINELDDAV